MIIYFFAWFCQFPASLSISHIGLAVRWFSYVHHLLLFLPASWFISCVYTMSVLSMSVRLQTVYLVKLPGFHFFPTPKYPLTPCTIGVCELLNLENISRMNLLTTNWSIFYCSFLLVSGFYNIWNCRASYSAHIVTISGTSSVILSLPTKQE